MKKIDLHGYYQNEVATLLPIYLRDEFYRQEKEILIICGKGEGIVQKQTADILEKSEYVKNFTLAHPNLGSSFAYHVYFQSV